MNQNKKDGIPFNGFQSVLEMLQNADAGFRSKIINNVRKLDPYLAKRLEAALAETMNYYVDDTSNVLDRAQQKNQTRNYGRI